MLFRLIRMAPLAAAGWRMFQNYRRRNGGATRPQNGPPPPQTYR